LRHFEQIFILYTAKRLEYFEGTLKQQASVCWALIAPG